MTIAKQHDDSNKLYWVKQNLVTTGFPDVEQALRDPDGLLAIGGDLSTVRLLDAYQRGIFPWFNEGQPILWWSPDPRCVLKPGDLKISRSLAKCLRQNKFQISYNTAFAGVLKNCAAARDGVADTWITNAMKVAYLNLFDMGYAHSVECWHEGKLVGGLYGLALGKVFFGESMFSKESNASKVALVNLVRRLMCLDFILIDCQVHSSHLQSLGATPMRRALFIRMLAHYCNHEKLDRLAS